jgi:2-dehydropantoate 2-reductase
VPGHRPNQQGGDAGSGAARGGAAAAAEAQAIGQSCLPGVARNTRGGAPPDHKPSLLQDYEQGRAMEIDTLVRAPAAFARAAGLSTPMLDLLAALAIRKARDKGLWRG